MKLKLALALALLSTLAHAATTPPKVVFIGDYQSYLWANTFAANSNWINKGADGAGVFGQDSDAILARFQSDVVALHPAVVHIMIGLNDAINASPSSLASTPPYVESNLDKMVKEAQAANIKVILGTEITGQGEAEWPELSVMNAMIEAYGAANNIPVVNYGDAICGCVMEFNGTNGDPDRNQVYYSTTTDPKDQGEDSNVVPSATGYTLMTQMAATAIAAVTTAPTLKGGYLQNVEPPDPNIYDTARTNVNTVIPTTELQFTPFGNFSDGSLEVLSNTNAQGNNLYGTWTSSNPLVMSINQQGFAYALTPGTAIIHFTPANGIHVSEWIMYVQAGD
jgi:lysophospholipase L1-like esterase